MRQSVVFTAEARSDLGSVLEYVAQESPALAIRLVDRLEKAAAGLGDSPLRYPLVSKHESSGVRRRVFGSYNIYYWVRRDTVEILHILHGARDYESIVFPDD